MKTVRTILMFASIMILVGPVLADWEPGDPYKMHSPQLPDPNGWDIYTFGEIDTRLTLADDFLCTQTGPIEDIHFWISFKGDDWSGDPADVGPLSVGLWSNNPGSKFPPKPSRPRDRLWSRTFKHYQFTFREDGQGDQSFYNPETGEFKKADHKLFYQINITGIQDPFVQNEGQVYWLSLGLQMAQMDVGMSGCKTSVQQWADDAVWAYEPLWGVPIVWHPISDPVTGESLDLAFVITPEPGTMVLLCLGGVGVLARRRRKRS